jgi:hypothetical protein
MDLQAGRSCGACRRKRAGSKVSETIGTGHQAMPLNQGERDEHH